MPRAVSRQVRCAHRSPLIILPLHKVLSRLLLPTKEVELDPFLMKSSSASLTTFDTHESYNFSLTMSPTQDTSVRFL